MELIETVNTWMQYIAVFGGLLPTIVSFFFGKKIIRFLGVTDSEKSIAWERRLITYCVIITFITGFTSIILSNKINKEKEAPRRLTDVQKTIIIDELKKY